MINLVTMKRQGLLILIATLTLIGTHGAGFENYDMRMNVLGVNRGLSNNHVVGITQDKNGFIWIATDEGLNRYDGYSFKTYYKEEKSTGAELTGNELNWVIDDPIRPIIWIATQRAGLNRYDYQNDSFLSYRNDPGNPRSLVTDDVTSVAPAADGGLWVTTYWKGIDHLNPETGEFTHYNANTVKGMPDASVLRVVDSGDGLLYAVHEHHGFTIIDIAGRTARNFLPQPGVRSSLPTADLQCVYRDSLNNIWIGGFSGLFLFNRNDNSFTDIGARHPELRYPVFDIRMCDDNLWVAMERGGMAYLKMDYSSYQGVGQTECIAVRGAREQVSSPSVRCLFQDRHSNIWAGTWGSGVTMLRQDIPPFVSNEFVRAMSNDVDNTSTSLFTLLFDDKGGLWTGWDCGGLHLYGIDRRRTTYTQRNGLPGDIVQASWKAPDGKLWFGFFDAGSSVFDPSTESFRNVFPAGSHEDVRDIVGLPDGSVAIASSRGIWVQHSTPPVLSGPISVGNGLIRKIFPIGNNRILLGTFGSGLIVTDGKFNVLDMLMVTDGFPSNTVNDIFRSRDGKIWVATGEGLVLFPDMAGNPDKFTVINKASGLSNSHVQAILQDRGGNIWVSTNGGISCIRGSEILNYSHRDHVPLGNFLAHSCDIDKHGNLYFGSISGLCAFDPSQILENIPAPEVFLEDVSVLGYAGDTSAHSRVFQVTGKDRLKLNPGQNSFEISFTTGNFANADEVEYAYMLEGLDDDWTIARNGNVAVFRDLPSGSYIFMVKARLRNHDWGEVSRIKVILPPPFWRSWWAVTIYILLALVILGYVLYLYYRRVNAEVQLHAEQEQHRHEQELNDERLRFYTNITHELRTPLSLVVGPLEDLSKSQNIPDKEHKSVEMVHRNAVRLLDLVNRILEFRKTETQNRRLCVSHGNIARTVYEVALKYKELNRRVAVKVNIITDSGNMTALFDKDVVTVILDNLISNAVKYTEKGNIDIICNRVGDNIVMKVADTGRGISSDSIGRIFERYYQEQGPHQVVGSGIGLALVKNVVKLHHGDISVESEPGQGTVFTVTIPVEGSYPEALHTEEEEPAVEKKESDESSDTLMSGDGKPVVLVVEDNEDIRDYVKQSFTDLYEIHCAENGQEGMQKAFELTPSVIVSDIMMPVMDGVEMTRRLKGDIRTSHIPIILLTAKVKESDRTEGYDSGADSYLTKPFSSTLLQSRINNLLLQRMKLANTFASVSSVPTENTNADQKPHKEETYQEKRQNLMKSLGKLDRAFIEKLDKTISESLATETVDVTFISGALCMSASTLYRKVKALTGLSPNEYIRKTKMHIAAELILEENLTMSEIAYKVGINSLAYFRQCFRDEFGTLPSEYLKKARQEK